MKRPKRCFYLGDAYDRLLGELAQRFGVPASQIVRLAITILGNSIDDNGRVLYTTTDGGQKTESLHSHQLLRRVNHEGKTQN